MGRLIDRPKWEEKLEIKHHHLLNGLDRHLAFEPDSLELGGWFDDGRSGSPVARVMRHPNTAQLILKFCASRQRADQLGLALRPRNSFVIEHLAQLEGKPFSLGEGDAYAAFMQLAGGDLRDYQSLAKLREANPARTDIEYDSIVRSVIGDWNEGRPTHVPRTVRSIVGGIVGRRRGNVIRWIRAANDLSSRVPLGFLAGAAGRWVVNDLLVGKAHGDLSGRNILIRSKPMQARNFELIDYDHYTEGAPLARDPMHLLVALALDDWNFLRAAGPDVIKAIVDPYQADTGSESYFRTISLAIHEACKTSFSKQVGLGDLWTAQCLLALVGVALLRVGRTITTAEPEAARQWCYELAVAAAERYCEEFDGTKSSNVPPVTGGREIVDRYFEREALTDCLAFGPHGVLSVVGKTGVGKSKLVDTVIKTFGGKLRHERRHAARDYRFDVPTLIELISGEPASVGDRPGAALVRLEAVLKQKQDPVVIAIESAEQLIDPDTRRLVDLGLDEAFTLLNTDDGHRVSVILETDGDEALATTGPEEDNVTVLGLCPNDFFELLREMDPGDRIKLNGLSSEARRELWQYAEGIPRIGELVYATVCHANVPLQTLLKGLQEHRYEQTAYLIRTLTDRMHPLGQKVIRALAAIGTPVPARVVQEIFSEVQPDQVQQSLWNLHADHLLRVESDLFFMPGADARAVLEQMPALDRRKLSFAAANALEGCVVKAPRNLADLRYHLAVVRARLGAGAFPLALQLMEDIDEYLRSWNCTPVLLPQRLEVRGNLHNPELEKINENALGGIYLAIGALKEAHDAYESALRLAGADAEPNVLARLCTNLATVHWESNNVDRARVGHEDALRRATEAGDLIAAMGAMNGLADCHRRRGEYAEAIGRATEAFEIFRSRRFAELREVGVEGRSIAVGLAVRLSRWYAEQSDLEQARSWLEETRAIAEQADAWHQATYLDTLADLQLFEGLRIGAVDEAIETAGRAVDLAFKVQDRTTLLQARTTLCVAHLCAGRTPEAAMSITRAAWHRPPGRHLVVLGLEALTKRMTDEHRVAGELFDDLRKEAGRRIAQDTGVSVRPGGVIQIGRADFAARHFQGFAQCGLALAGRADIASAITSFRMPDVASPPRAPGLVERMVFMLERLDNSASRPGTLQPVIDALRNP